MMKKQMNVPVLRFPGFEGEWKKKKLGEVTEIFDGTHQTPKYIPSGIPFYSVEQVTANDFFNTKFISEEVYKNEKVFIEKGDILMTRIGDIGTARYVDWNVQASFYVSLALIKKSFNYSSQYFSYYIATKKFQNELWSRTIHVAFPRKINLGEIGKCIGAFPSLPEQIKLASFLTAVDKKLQTFKKKKSLLEAYKKGVMQKFFSQELRFKDDDGKDFPDWEDKRLGEVAERVTRKNKEANTNVLTISAQFGLISQLEFFNKSVSAKDVTGYYLLNQNDFAYNKSYSNGYPMGAIKRLTRYSKGVVSTLYICFRFKDDIDLCFMEYYFETGLQNSEIEKVAQEGARNHGLLNIGVSDFFSINIIIPSLPEQVKIANFLFAIDEKINHIRIAIDKTAEWKKGLLQKMFV